jgi:hypothetical protein
MYTELVARQAAPHASADSCGSVTWRDSCQAVAGGLGLYIFPTGAITLPVVRSEHVLRSN